MPELLDVLPFLFLILAVVVFITQVVAPLVHKQPLFPFFRPKKEKPILVEMHEYKQRDLNNQLEIAKDELEEAKLEQEIETIRAKIRREKENGITGVR